MLSFFLFVRVPRLYIFHFHYFLISIVPTDSPTIQPIDRTTTFCACACAVPSFIWKSSSRYIQFSLILAYHVLAERYGRPGIDHIAEPNSRSAHKHLDTLDSFPFDPTDVNSSPALIFNGLCLITRYREYKGEHAFTRAYTIFVRSCHYISKDRIPGEEKLNIFQNKIEGKNMVIMRVRLLLYCCAFTCIFKYEIYALLTLHLIFLLRKIPL